MMSRLNMISILEYPLGEPVTSYPGNWLVLSESLGLLPVYSFDDHTNATKTNKLTDHQVFFPNDRYLGQC